MITIRNWCERPIRQRADGFFSATDIAKACGIGNYSLDDWMELGRGRRVSFYIDEDNDCWVCPSVAQELARTRNQDGLFSLIKESWDDPKPLIGNDFYTLVNAISYLEECGLPGDMELARLLRENLKSKI